MVYHSCRYIFIFVMFVLGLKLNCLFLSCLMALKYKERIFFYLSLPLFFSRPTLPHVLSPDAWETGFFFEILPGNRLSFLDNAWESAEKANFLPPFVGRARSNSLGPPTHRTLLLGPIAKP